MANTIELANKFMPILDEIYKRESLTSRLDAPTKPVDFAGANEVKVFKTSVVGLGDYSRATGYPAGDVTASWETIQLTCERGRAFSIDRMNDEESLGMAFGTLAGEFIRTKVVPEVDAYRMARYAGWASVDGAAAVLDTAAKVLSAFDAAMAAMDANEVPKEGRLCFIASARYRLLMAAVTRQLKNEPIFDRRLSTLDGVPLIEMPQSRLYSAVTLDAGATSGAGGYVNSGVNLNFALLHPSAVDQATKLASLKIFTPEENQLADSWLFQYRLYHDCWVYDNKVNGVYIHKVS